MWHPIRIFQTKISDPAGKAQVKLWQRGSFSSHCKLTRENKRFLWLYICIFCLSVIYKEWKSFFQSGWNHDIFWLNNHEIFLYEFLFFYLFLTVQNVVGRYDMTSFTKPINVFFLFIDFLLVWNLNVHFRYSNFVTFLFLVLGWNLDILWPLPINLYFAMFPFIVAFAGRIGFVYMFITQARIMASQKSHTQWHYRSWAYL